MRVSRLATAIGAAVIMSACGGTGTQESGTTQDTVTVAMGPTTPTTGTATAAPITGTTHEVRMLGDETGYRYEPANLTIKAGDGVRFINVNGSPHDISFDPNTIPAAGRAQLTANMPNQRAELTSQLFIQPNETYTISFGNVAPGNYPFICIPHLAMGMRGQITVQ
ncbi:MAG TPA: plastocyanin/azurin family copper-binding protein [Gemmatimonadaceae bacterium]|nr:plastocyanin/azurin family copper-binding protein [Gemmatimonadaceae bacterium]